MGAVQSDKIHDLAVTLASAAATLPVPSAAPSAQILADFKKWEGGVYTPMFATLSIDSDGAGNITDGKVYGFDLVDAAWRLIALLNGGVQIDLTATVGFEQRFTDAGIFAALAVSGTISAGNVTVKATPVGTKE